MCKHEIIGDFYRGCGHFHGRYYTGETVDCGSPSCKGSREHEHRSASNCGCMMYVVHDRRVQNMFQVTFPECHSDAQGKVLPNALGNALPDPSRNALP